MAQALPIISAAVSIFGGIKQYKDARSAAKEQEKMGRQQAAMTRAQGAEEKRRAARAEAVRSGESVAKMAASGLAPTGSLAMWERAQQEEAAKQLSWLGKATESQAAIDLLAGKTAAKQTKASGEAALWSGIGGGLSTPGLWS